MADALVTDPAKPGAVATESVAKSTTEQPDNTVMVKALKPYLGAEDKRSVGVPGHKDGEPYAVTRRRAAELIAHGLAEYTSDDDAERAVADAVKEAGDRARAQRGARR